MKETEENSKGSRRYPWDALPSELQSVVEQKLGKVVVSASTQPGGFTSGVAAILNLDNERVFVKAVPHDDQVVDAYRHEARIAVALPVEIRSPRLRFSIDDLGWVLLCFDVVDGSLPNQPWTDEELIATFDALASTARALTPNPIAGVDTIEDAIGKSFTVWRELVSNGVVGRGLTIEHLSPGFRSQIGLLAELESTWAVETRGDTLNHLDIRSDNLIVDDNNDVWIVDWSWPCVAVPWVDLLSFLPSIDRSPQYMSQVVDTHELTRDLDVGEGNGFLAAIAGIWIESSIAPPFAHAPHVRAQQSRYGEKTLRWLEHRGVDLRLLGDRGTVWNEAT